MNGSDGIAALVLAAGRSSRMGALKPLLPIGGSTAIERAVNGLREAGIENIKAVVGYGAHEIIPLLEGVGAEWVLNEDFDRGMLSSILAGIRSLEPDVRAFFLLPADVPMVKPDTIQALVRAYRESLPPVVYPVFQGRRGHPPLISMECVAGLGPDHEGGMRAFLQSYDEEALEIETTDEAILMDCDTPRDYRALRIYGSRKEIPSERECRAMWARYGVSEDVKAHSLFVAELARLMAVHLNRRGFDLDLDLVVAGGLLHDLARNEPGHAAAGARIMEELGYGRTARVVASHMDITPAPRPREADLVYLADKLVRGDRPVSLNERFAGQLTRFAGEPEILRAVTTRMHNAQTIRDRIQAAIGFPPEDLIRRHARTFETLSCGREIYLIRHGEIEPANGLKRYIGQADLQLTARGLRQAQALADELSEARLTAVYCSDLRRSVETATVIGQPHGLKPEVRVELREIALGDWEELTFDEVRRRRPEEFMERGNDIVNFRPSGGESFFDCSCRVLPAFYSLLRETRGNAAIVGHAGVNRIILSQLTGASLADLFDIPQDYGCMNVIRQESAFEFTLLEHNENHGRKLYG